MTQVFEHLGTHWLAVTFVVAAAVAYGQRRQQ
jgi:hypothetical protein